VHKRFCRCRWTEAILTQTPPRVKMRSLIHDRKRQCGHRFSSALGQHN